jgi:hypothetical protein
MATVNQVLQGLISQIGASLGGAYVIPESGTVQTHVNATDLINGTSKVGGAWAQNGVLTYDGFDSPRASIAAQSLGTGYLTQANSPLAFASTPFTLVALIKMTSAVGARGTYSAVVSTDFTGSNAGGLRLYLGSSGDPRCAFQVYSGTNVESAVLIADTTVAGFNVIIAGNDGTNLFIQINGGTVATAPNGGYAAGTVTTAYLLTDPSLIIPLEGGMFEFMACSAIPSVAAFNNIYGQIQANISATVQIGGGWPSKNHLDDITLGNYSLISVYDGDGTRNTTRWGRTPAALDTQPATPGVSAALSTTVLTAGKTATLTLTGTPNVGDAAVLSAQSTLGPAVLGSATTGAAETLAQLATALAASIQSGAYAAANLTAAAVGGVITLTNASGGPAYQLQANTGNVGSRLWENRRVERHVRVIVWTNSDANRQVVGDPLDVLFAQLSNYFGFALPTGEWVRLKYMSDTYVEDAQLADVYRRDFRISLEYGVNQTDLLYPILGTSLTLTP